jgi:SAM-dependent methyltransferase
MATNLNLTDMETCYKVFRGEDFRSIPLESPRFGFEPEITAKVARLGLRIYEVPISYHGRTYEAGKKIGWKDGLSAIWTIAWYWMFDGLSRMDGMLASLLALRAANRFNRWMFDTIKPWVGARVLEAGCGIGNLTAFLQRCERVVAVDHEPRFVAKVAQEFANAEHITTRVMDLTDPKAYDGLEAEHLDTVVCLNVIEHIEPAVEVLQSFHRILVPGGRAIILVPQGQELFGTMDETVGHLRRYDEAGLREVMEAAGFEVETLFGFNRAATPGWWLNGRVLGRVHVPPAQVRFYDKLIPLVRRIDPLLPLPPLSLIAVGKKT